MAKRSHEDAFGSPSSVSHTSFKAEIHGILSNVSPDMKKTKTSSYFDGEINDEHMSLRIFGYDSNVRRKLFEFQSRGEPVVLSKCAVKRSRDGKELEVFASSNTSVATSSKKFDVDAAKER